MFIIIGGNPFTCYTGTTTFTGLQVVAKTESFEEMKQIVKDCFDEVGGLILVLFNGEELEVDNDLNWIDPTI